jgi:hypothetical protein
LWRYPPLIDVSSPETENFRSAAIPSRNLANLSPCTPNRDEQHQDAPAPGISSFVHDEPNLSGSLSDTVNATSRSFAA